MIPNKIKKDMACDRIGRKLVKYLEKHKEKDVIDFKLRIDSETHFYIHPDSVDGETLDISWDIKSGTYGSEVFGYVNKGNEFDDPDSNPPPDDSEKDLWQKLAEVAEELIKAADIPKNRPDTDNEQYLLFRELYHEWQQLKSSLPKETPPEAEPILKSISKDA